MFLFNLVNAFLQSGWLFYDWSSLVISFCLWFKASGLLKDIVQTLQHPFIYSV